MLSFEVQIATFRLSVFNRRRAQLIVIFVPQLSAVIGRFQFNPHNFLRRASVVTVFLQLFNVIFDCELYTLGDAISLSRWMCFQNESQTRNFTSCQSI